MESSSVISDASVYYSPDGSNESPATEKIRSSVSVSSLAEKFEKSGEFVKGEDGSVKGVRLSESSGSVSEYSTDGKDCSNSPKIHVSESTGKENEVDQPLCKETSEKSKDVAQDIKNMSDSVFQSSGTVGDVMKQDDFILSESRKAVEERVAYFVDKISKSSKDYVKTDNSNISPKKETEKLTSKAGVPTQLSLKDLEKSFVTALNLANANEDKVTDILSVPSIKITAASDREDSSSDDSEETKQKSEISRIKNKASVEEMDTSDANMNDEKVEPTPSTSTAFQGENNEPEVSAEERKAFFYLSSSDLPPGLVNDTLESTDELRQRSTNRQGRAENFVTPQLETRNPSCLCSKAVHGTIFVFSFVIAILGFILYSLANEGRVPHFCQYLGLATSVIAGTVGAFCCFCFTFLEAFPRLVIPGYERLSDAENASAPTYNRNAQAQNLDDESWSSEKERAFRIQNGMSSTRTSAASLERMPSNSRELIEKTEKLKKDVVELLDSFTEMVKQEKSEEVSEMESGVANKRVH